MALTLVSTTAAERLLRHVESLSETEAEDALRLLVRQREQIMSIQARHPGSRASRAPAPLRDVPSRRRAR